MPHIIRGTDVKEINQRPIDIGTATTIELRHSTSKTPAAAAPEGSQPSITSGPGESGSTPAQPRPRHNQSGSPESRGQFPV